MAVTLTFPLNQDYSTSHYGLPNRGNIGRGGHTIVGICLHELEMPMESYIGYLQSDRLFADIRPGEHGSVHYGIEADGTLHQFVLNSNTAWGVSSLNSPTWALIGSYIGIDTNYLFIHVGVERFISATLPTLMFRSLSELVAKLCIDYAITADANHIITHTKLNSTFIGCGFVLTSDLLANIQALIAVGNDTELVNVSQLFQAVAALQIQVDNLEAEFADSLATIETYAAHVTTKASASVLGHIESGSTLDTNASTGLTNVKVLAASYKITTASQVIVASIPAVVQFPVVVSDDLSWATLGAFQKVTPTVAGLFRLRAHIRFAPSTWTAGKTLFLEVYKNGVTLSNFAYKTIESNLVSKIVELQGEFPLVSAIGDYYQIYVTTDDANGTKTIAAGEFSMERIGA